MAAFTSLSLQLLGGRRLPITRPKRKRGRPRKPQAWWWDVPPPQQRGRVGAPKRHDVDDQWIVALVDDWKAERHASGDAAAIAQLLYHHAPHDTRQRLDRRRAHLERTAETNYRLARALQDAVKAVEGPRFDWWVKRLDRARRNLNRKGGWKRLSRSKRISATAVTTQTAETQAVAVITNFRRIVR
jgi:hypothetical protein